MNSDKYEEFLQSLQRPLDDMSDYSSENSQDSDHFENSEHGPEFVKIEEEEKVENQGKLSPQKKRKYVFGDLTKKLGATILEKRAKYHEGRRKRWGKAKNAVLGRYEKRFGPDIVYLEGVLNN